MTRSKAAIALWGWPAVTAVVMAITLGVAAAAWVFAVPQMRGMDMGTATQLGSFGFFMVIWVAMMAAMMLPGVLPAILRRAHADGGVGALPLFVVAYLAVWALVGLALFVLYRPHGTTVAGGVVIGAGLYELTPLKRHCRGRCFENLRSGVGFGLYCVGSSVGLMLTLVVLGVMNLRWMVVATVLVVGQKLLPARAVVDVPLALTLFGFGVLILIAPTAIPGLTPSM